ncbi:uncharacterized protein LOC124795080 [Schistocerca piceifrons]|uniref:uncharacterized protein LOC124795080 n=1 Tax=Schistocerca piceifrons TaxID=274613 RepID=UPI001F5F7DB2|nr:uncharacterized protein LOC124795080 [Schistocerca piceifrons]
MFMYLDIVLFTVVNMASLVADYSSTDSESSSDTDSEEDVEETNKGGCSSEKLPHPEFGSAGISCMKSSVFSNPFVEAENAKKAILEKHVKMTPTKEEITMINGKKICWNFRKGRCRFGHNCKFAHDSDLPNVNTENQSESGDVYNGQTVVLHDSVGTGDSEISKCSENLLSVVSKKKRPGLAQELVPGKKVLKLYKKQKVKDGIWSGSTAGNK